MTLDLRSARSLTPGERAELFDAAHGGLLRGLGTVGVLNLPEDDPAASALRSLGATVVVRQHEMLLELEH